MPYQQQSDLPERVTDSLPKHGQEIYKEAFNSAWERYDTQSERQAHRNREETAHAVAWSAVKKVYKKSDDGNWIKKSD